LNKVLFIASVVLLSACSLAKFTNYPGVAQPAFPEAMQGTYYYVLQTSIAGQKKAGDTIFYHVTPNAIVLFDSTKREEKPLDANQVLTLVQQKYWVLSTKDSDWPDYWNCMVYMADKKDLHIYPILDNRGKDNLSKYFSKKLLTVKDNADSVFVYTATDEQFARYFNKEVKGVLKLKRLHSNQKK
jgi:hypothetical protein